MTSWRRCAWVPVYVEALGVKPPLEVRTWLARLLAGKDAGAAATGMRGAGNAKSRARTGPAAGTRAGARGFAVR